jgi:hypothetical protein
VAYKCGNDEEWVVGVEVCLCIGQSYIENINEKASLDLQRCCNETLLTYPVNPKVGVISDSHKISDSIPRICRNDTSKLAPSLQARHDPRLMAREPGRSDGPAKIKITRAMIMWSFF